MKRWEYREVSTPGSLVEALTELGAEGWEAVNFAVQGDCAHVLLKRQLPEEHSAPEKTAGEPDAVRASGDLCRDCGIERAFATGSCRACLRFIVREDFGGPRVTQHAAGCSLATAEDYAPRTEEEINDVWARREARTDG